MGINTIIENLDNTIAGKIALRTSVDARARSTGGASGLVASVTVQFLDANIEELECIRNALVSVRTTQESQTVDQ
jgi:hypothetical protein